MKQEISSEFDILLTRVMRVTKPEMEKKMDDYKKAAAENPKKRGPKKKRKETP